MSDRPGSRDAYASKKKKKKLIMTFNYDHSNIGDIVVLVYMKIKVLYENYDKIKTNFPGLLETDTFFAINSRVAV